MQHSKLTYSNRTAHDYRCRQQNEPKGWSRDRQLPVMDGLGTTVERYINTVQCRGLGQSVRLSAQFCCVVVRVCSEFTTNTKIMISHLNSIFIHGFKYIHMAVPTLRQNFQSSFPRSEYEDSVATFQKFLPFIRNHHPFRICIGSLSHSLLQCIFFS